MGGERNIRESSIERSNPFKWPWGDIIVRIMLWLLLGIALNIVPPFIAYLVAGGTFTVVLSSGDLLIATTAILPLPLADLASVQRAPRAKIIIVSIGALVCAGSLIFYCFAFANYLSQVYHQSTFAKYPSPELAAKLSVGFFLGAVVLGSICAGFLAVDKKGSGERSESGG